MTQSTPNDNPFRVGGVVTGRFFTDRAAERRRIARALTEPQAHLLVFGPRRMGKTSTLRVVQDDLARDGRQVILADLSTASALADLATRLLQAAVRAMGRSWPDTLEWLLKRVGVKVAVSPDPSGLLLPSVDVGLRSAPLEEQRAPFGATLDAIEALAAKNKAHVGLVLDEFQEIHRFGAETAEAHLRSVIQHHRHVSYVLAGSEERLIEAMTGPRRPLYKLLETLQLGPMDPAHLARWIEERMASGGVKARGAGPRVIAVGGPRTRDVVQLAREVFEGARASGRATDDGVRKALRRIVVDEDAPQRARWDELTALQQNVLRALAVRADGLTTAAIRGRFGLGTQGAATKAAQALIARSFLVKDGTSYRYDSPFARGWVIVHALPDLGIDLPADHVP